MQRFLWPIATLLAVTSCGDDGPVSAPFGLDKRPANPTCIAKQRPVLNTGVKLQQQWTGVTFNQPLYLTQAPGDSTQWYEVERQGKVRVFPTGATGNCSAWRFTPAGRTSARSICRTREPPGPVIRCRCVRRRCARS
ncbi:MAG: hypothetical protein E6J91_15525 [Deltaproteobacteria bacterium]|nr:MAG: hypothetical protein E6J91_15525 [Deltaproteobacteria bacterium]